MQRRFNKSVGRSRQFREDREDLRWTPEQRKYFRDFRVPESERAEIWALREQLINTLTIEREKRKAREREERAQRELALEQEKLRRKQETSERDRELRREKERAEWREREDNIEQREGQRWTFEQAKEEAIKRADRAREEAKEKADRAREEAKEKADRAREEAKEKADRAKFEAKEREKERQHELAMAKIEAGITFDADITEMSGDRRGENCSINLSPLMHDGENLDDKNSRRVINKSRVRNKEMRGCVIGGRYMLLSGIQATVQKYTLPKLIQPNEIIKDEQPVKSVNTHAVVMTQAKVILEKCDVAKEREIVVCVPNDLPCEVSQKCDITEEKETVLCIQNELLSEIKLGIVDVGQFGDAPVIAATRSIAKKKSADRERNGQAEYSRKASTDVSSAKKKEQAYELFTVDFNLDAEKTKKESELGDVMAEKGAADLDESESQIVYLKESRDPPTCGGNEELLPLQNDYVSLRVSFENGTVQTADVRSTRKHSYFVGERLSERRWKKGKIDQEIGQLFVSRSFKISSIFTGTRYGKNVMFAKQRRKLTDGPKIRKIGRNNNRCLSKDKLMVTDNHGPNKIPRQGQTKRKKKKGWDKIK